MTEPIELTTEEAQSKKHIWTLYWSHATDLDANYRADEETLRKAGYVPLTALQAAEARNAELSFALGKAQGEAEGHALMRKAAEAELGTLGCEFRRQGVLHNLAINERESLRAELLELNDTAADLVAEAVGPYDPPQRGSRLEKLYLLVSRPCHPASAVVGETEDPTCGTPSSKSPNSAPSASGETAGSVTPGSTSSALVSEETQTRPGEKDSELRNRAQGEPATGDGYKQGAGLATNPAKSPDLVNSDSLANGVAPSRGDIGALSTPAKKPAKADRDSLGYATVAGEWMEKTIAEHVRACEVLIGEEQRKPSPANHLVAVLCDSVRMAREYVREAKHGVAVPAKSGHWSECHDCVREGGYCKRHDEFQRSAKAGDGGERCGLYVGFGDDAKMAVHCRLPKGHTALCEDWTNPSQPSPPATNPWADNPNVCAECHHSNTSHGKGPCVECDCIVFMPPVAEPSAAPGLLLTDTVDDLPLMPSAPLEEQRAAPGEFIFWVQSERWTTTDRSMNVAVLKHYVRMPANYSLRLMSSIDTHIPDDRSVDLTCEPHFIFIPPANY